VCPIIGDFIVTYKGQKIYEFCAQISGNAPHAHFILEKDILLKIKLIFISKILPSRRFIPIVITLSQCPITIPDCRLNSRIPRFSWPLYQSYDAPDKSTTRQDFRYYDQKLDCHLLLRKQKLKQLPLLMFRKKTEKILKKVRIVIFSSSENFPVFFKIQNCQFIRNSDPKLTQY
jgi:hypothetical protein